MERKKKKKFPVKADRIIIKFRKTISFRIMRKITVNRKDKALIKMELRHRYVPWKLLRFLTVIFSDVFQKFISTARQIFNISNKVTSMIMNRSSHWRCSVRKAFLRNWFSWFSWLPFENTPTNKDMLKVDDTIAISVNVI